MVLCAHQSWLRLHQDESSFVLQYGNRLEHITRSLPRPARQFPSLVSFIGKRSKARALRALFPGSDVSRRRNYGIANICLESATLDDEHPVLIADSSVGHAQAGLRGKHSCHESISYPVTWSGNENSPPSQQDVAEHIHARLLSLFVDVLCIFAQDCGGLDTVADKLATWSAIGSASTLPRSVRPRLLIVTSISGPEFSSEALRFRLRVLSDSTFSASFTSLNVINILGPTHPPSRELFSGLGIILRDEFSKSRAERINTHTLFSMVHVTAFFDMALRNFATSPQHTFDFIGSTRESNPVPASFLQHLTSFMGLCSEHKLPANILWDFIASAIILDSFPPDMHLFNPSAVFRAFYHHACLLGVHGFAESFQLSSDLICNDIEANIISLFSRMKSGGQTAAILRQQSLERNSQHWQLLKSNVDCLICLQRKPEHFMECGHGICDMCVSNPIFSKPTKGREYYYDITTCPQCRTRVHFQARTLPPTCRVRFVAFDGGGSRGVVPLVFMAELDEALDLPYPIQEHIDFSIGTSSGGIATIGLFGKYWTPKKCLSFFRKFARRIFPRSGMRHSVWAIIKRVFAFYLEDGKYDATVLEDALKEALGPGSIFSSVGLRPSGVKFAVTATTISDATLCLITNYNGESDVNKDLRYKHLRATRPSEEMLLWEAARCTTAAPTFFKPKYLRMFGALQDGGLKYNNPVRPGLRDARRIWKDVGCDIVLSIGTGYEQKLLSPVAANVRNLFQDGALARLYRASMQSLSLNGQISWEDHWYGLEEETKKQQFRLNLPLRGKEPDIDDVDKMQYLCDQVRYHLGDIEGIARAFKAVSFFFELDELPALDGGLYRCHGSVLSRSPDSRALVQRLASSYPYAQLFIDEISVGFLSSNDICQLCGRFQKAIVFHVRHPSDRINLYLAFNRLFRRNISAFPQSMEWFVERQKLNAKFGQPDHKSRVERSKTPPCSCGLQRSSETSSLAPGKKRRSPTLGMRTRKKQRCL
ncbi:Intracellular membrane-associated calcium-independent phospholipase A2 gamma [Hyphodiscus hymeniophilus]|uniref:Intracellular membrane-associated calcium-independent phospholipase A2 gamma n=1 Tax=Hyphodiscus hymeniophilus TaxID=353542 RepID=A0A9P6SPE2_9HELO|nr:Intracellular membrane-associated calcium-independent phospholipase A2 gamma [Hyphodiscus hymeniophilus]